MDVAQTSSLLGGDPSSWPVGKASAAVQAARGLRADKPVPLTRAERIRRFGVDCGDGLEWAATWVPGGEYTKNLVVKNVSKHVIKLKPKLPETKFFSMAFPEMIKLTPGLSKTLQINFRPLRLEAYDDCVEFMTETGSFVVPVRANIPTISSQVPSNLDFGFCPVKETDMKTFHIHNDGEVPINFTFSAELPFEVSPASGSVKPREAATITATFRPTEACVYVANCVCSVPGHTNHVIKMGGIGKYPFVTSSQERIDFGPVLSGQAETKYIKLRNSSLVYGRFKLARVVSDVEPVFVFSPTSGIIPPDGELTVACQYRPKVTGTFTSDHYQVQTPGGNTVPIECMGEATGPDVQVSKEIINFNDVPIELPRKSSSRILELINHSDVAVPYLLYGCEPNGLFTVSSPSGVLPPHLSAHINLTFSPIEPGNYYKRIYILLLNAAPTAIDLIGSGYNDKRRPLPIEPRFVHEYLQREGRGLHRLSPEELQQRNETRRAAQERGEAIDEEEFDPTTSDVAIGMDVRGEQALMRALFRGSAWRQGAVYFDEDQVDFGAGSRLRTSEPRTIRVTNRTSGKLALQWAIPSGYVKGSPKDKASPVFAITPPSIDLLPHSTASFSLQFRPQSDQQYYVQTLECFVTFKSMRTFRLVSEDNFALPWCLTLSASGHSFPPNAEQFIPRGLLSHRTLTFPAVHVGDAAYQTISIKNDNDTPMLFDVSSDLPAAFKILPAVGLVPAGDTQLLAVRFSPGDATRFQKVAQITLNNDSGAALSLTLVGTGCRAALSMPSKLFCPTACVGASSHTTMQLTNPSRLPLAYEWDIPQRMQSVLSVDQPAGVLRGRESIQLAWSFSPAAERNYLIKVPCLVSALEDGVDGGTHDIVKQQLSVSGVGSTGVILAEPQHLDFGTVLVGNTHRRTLTLINSSSVDLFYTLTFALESRSGATGASGQLTADELLSCEQATGLVPARNTVDVRLILKPPAREAFEFSVSVTLRPGASSGLGRDTDEEIPTPGAVLGPPTELCRVTAIADFPQLQICDARLAGVAQELLWQQLRLPEVNTELRGVLSDAELQLLSSQVSSMGDVASIQASLPTIDMMMPPGLPGDPPMQLHLLVRNVGKLDAAFQVRYPTEMELQIEHWADKGEPSAVELKQHLIVDKNILAITPKKAELAPGQDVELIVRMRHFRADDYELPLLLQVTSGRQLVLNVQGRTLALGERYLHIPLREVRLPPTPIGLETAQRHTFELPNYTDVELPFDVQLAEINKLNKANHDFPIFVCENPTGVIPPGGIAHLRFRFLPLEEKDYHVALPVAIGSAGIRTFVLLASGYHPRDPIEYASFLNDMADLLPPSQQLMPPNQPMRLSFDRALFGQVPSGATLRKLVVIRNVHSMPCGYAWDTNHPLWGTILSVYPSHGTVAAGEHVCCKLSLSAIGPPEELKSTLHCHLTPHIDPDALTETEKALASSAHRPGSLGLLPSTHPLAAGTALRPRSPPRISVTEVRPRLRGLQALMHIEEREGRRQAAAAGLTAEEYSSTAAASNIAAVTLPPSAVNASLSGSGAPPSQPPKLLLDVRACISPPEVLELGGVSLSNFYIPRVLPPTEPPLPPSANTATSKPLHWHLSPAVVEQRETAEAIVSMMLTELLSDPTVTRAITSSDVAPVPWFDQVATSAAAAAGSASKGNALPLAGGYSEETAAGMPPAPMGMHMPIGGAPAMGGAPPPSHFAPQGGEPSSSAIAFEVGAVAAGATGAVGATTGGGGMASEALDEYAEEAAMEEADKLARAQRRADEVERKRREAEHAGRIRNSTDFQELVAYVLEGTLFNLVVEASHGEFPLETVPRQIVRSLEITQEESA